MPALVEKMCHFGEMPWHGESEKLIGNETTQEVMEKAGLDWTVETQPVFLEDGTKLPAQASIRTSDNSVLGVVGPRWTPLQNADAFKVFEPLVQSGDMAWHTAGSLRDGQRIWVLCQLALDNSEIVPGDEIAKFALLSNGHDGKLAVHFGFTPIRVVCANTEALARSCKASKLIRVRHHRFVKDNVEKLRDIMNLANQEFEATCDEYRVLAGRAINSDDLDKYVKIVFGQHKKTDSEIPTRSRNIMNRVVELFETGQGAKLEGVNGTWWGAYNAVTEYLNYEKGRTTQNRLDSLWFGQNGVQNRNALESALILSA